MPMIVLGISAYYHDAAAALIVDGKIVAAAQEERFSRIKNDAAFPKKAVSFCLDYSGYRMSELDAIVFYDKPFLKFERLLETYYSAAPRGLLSFVRAMPVWIKEKLLLKRILRKELAEIGEFDRKATKLLFSEHHLSHAASAFYPSGFQNAAILTIDGVGEWATATIGYGEGKDIRILKQLEFPNSPGLLYAAFTYYCGFEVNGGEYKLMGLAPYGDRNGNQYAKILQLSKSKLVDIAVDGSIFMHQEYFDYATGSRMVDDKTWHELFGFPRRQIDGPLKQEYADMAAAVQDLITEIMIRMARETKQLTGATKLCMAGGVALNCVANGALQREKLFDQIFVQPAAGDAGGAIGAALAGYYIYGSHHRQLLTEGVDELNSAYLGPSFTGEEVAHAARRFPDVKQVELSAGKSEAPEGETLVKEVARLLADGKIIGWFQGRSEFGPRALGNRSILADPRNSDMQKRLNLSIKFRESFRPFAPAVLEEKASLYFELDRPSPYMLFVAEIRGHWRKPISPGINTGSIMSKLYLQRSELPAITHVDFSARVQTVSQYGNPRFHELISAFDAITGVPMLVNTSFNVKDEPIVNTPEDAFNCFQNTGIDYLAIGNCLYQKNETT